MSATRKVWIATSGSYSDYTIRRVFAREEDAAAYPLADSYEAFEVTEGPVDVRPWWVLTWRTDEAGAPDEYSRWEEFDGNERRAEHHWYDRGTRGKILEVCGWDLERVRKVYSEQRAQYLAEQPAEGMVHLHRVGGECLGVYPGPEAYARLAEDENLCVRLRPEGC